MKPHEATLVVMKMDKERKCLVENDMRMVAVLRGFDSDEWERFLVATPKLARALLASGGMFRGEWHSMTCLSASTAYPAAPCSPSCVESRRVMLEAGVLDAAPIRCIGTVPGGQCDEQCGGEAVESGLCKYHFNKHGRP